jgi:hypothetical protein
VHLKKKSQLLFIRWMMLLVGGLHLEKFDQISIPYASLRGLYKPP